jgi:hypothetical protein
VRRRENEKHCEKERGGGGGRGGERARKEERELEFIHTSNFAGIITEKRHNFYPSTPPVSAENLHFKLNGETRRAPGPPVTGAKTAWEDADQVSFTVPGYSLRQAWARAA